MSRLAPRKDDHPKDFFDSTWDSLGTARGLWWLMTSALGMGAFFLWLLAVSELLAGILLGLSGACLFFAFLAKAKHDGEILYLSLSELTVVSVVGDGEKSTARGALSQILSKPQPNIVMLGTPRRTYIAHDEKFVFREDYKSKDRYWGVVVDFQNQLIPGIQIKALGGVLSQLTFSSEDMEFHFLNRGFWLKQESSEAVFERGDVRSLFIAYMDVFDNKYECVRTFDRRVEPPSQVSFSPLDSISVRIVLFTQTRHRFHKECDVGLTPELCVKKPLA
jgi:hypothetical protein